jgi:hypothetical protein
VLKRCSICKQVWYCGAACQKVVWRRHKKTCAPPLSTHDVRAKVLAANAGGEWREVLKWEGSMEELMEGQSDTSCDSILLRFQLAHSQESLSTDSQHIFFPSSELENAASTCWARWSASETKAS